MMMEHKQTTLTGILEKKRFWLYKTDTRGDQLGELVHHWTQMSLTWLIFFWESHQRLWPHPGRHF